MAKKTCFVIGAIGKSDSAERKDADDFIRVVTEPLRSEGFDDPVRADHIYETSLIFDDIVKHLANADLVLADLRRDNPSAYYELAARNMLRKPVIVFIRPDQSLPFDTHEYRGIHLDTSELASVDAAKSKLRKSLSCLPKNGAAPSPLSRAFDLMTLDDKGDATQRTIAHMAKQIDLLSSMYDQLSVNKNTIMYQMGNALRQVIDDLLEPIVNDLQQSKDECSERTLAIVRTIETRINSFAHAPFTLDQF
ncbi:MAG TPA: hypothetical protein VJL61_14740 [Rhodanobacteraceae bacterium]|nr:hypothetical protein [Rhodanobacteraceae bacterium]